MTESRANTNFHSATATSVFDGKAEDARFREYRRRWHENPATFTAGDFPIHLDLESTSYCNLRCPFCAATHDTWGGGRKGYLELALYRRLIDEGAEHGLCSVKLSLRGEPLLHRDLVEMVRYAKQRGVLDIYFNTNGLLLTPEISRQLIAAGLDRISVSIEGTTREEYERYRVGSDFDRVRENLRALRELRERAGSRFPAIRVQTVLLPELQAGFPDYVRYWRELADEVSYLDARRETARDYHCQPGREPAPVAAAGWACPFLWQRMMVLWDGTVFPCLMHGVRNFSGMTLGNARHQRLADLWRGEQFTRYRELHRSGRGHELPACAECSYRAMEIEKLTAKSSGSY